MGDGVVLAEGIQKSYRTGSVVTPVLRGVDLRVQAGECVLLLGPSGSGKSTLLSILGCVLSPDQGRLTLAGHDVTRLDRSQQAQFRRQFIGFVFQRFHLFQGLTALENVRVPLDLASQPTDVADRESRALLEAVELGDKMDSPVNQLSMGQRQRVAIARALAADPLLVFADEPTASLDARTGRVTVELLRALAKVRGKTVIIVTHDARILDYADRILHLGDGRLTEAATEVRTAN